MHTLVALTWMTAAHAGVGVDGTYDLARKAEQVVLQSVGGDVDVIVDQDLKRPEVVVVDRRPGRTCALDVKEKNRRSVVRFDAKDLEDPRDCVADFEVRLPADVAFTLELVHGTVDVPAMQRRLDLQVQEGLVRLGDLDGDTRVVMGRGDVVLGQLAGPVEVEIAHGDLSGTPHGEVEAAIGEGHIRLGQMVGPVVADTQVGNIELTFSTAPAGEVQLNAGHGHIVVDLPDDTPVRPRMTTWSGTKTCDLPTGDGPDVVAVSSMGSIRLH